MKAYWNTEDKCYGIQYTERELGTLIFALTVAKYETHDATVAELQENMLDVMNIQNVLSNTEKIDTGDLGERRDA